jgi:hypothetical protein
MTKCDIPAKTAIVPLCILGNTRPGQKVPGLSSVCALLPRCTGPNCEPAFNLVTMRRPRDAVHHTHREMAVCWVANHNLTVNLAKLVQLMLAKFHIQQIRQQQNSQNWSMGFFTISALKNCPTDKAFEDVGPTKITPHSNLYSCTKQTDGGASSSGRASGISLLVRRMLVQRGSVRNDVNLSDVGSTASVRCFLIRHRVGTSVSLTLQTEGLCLPQSPC